MLRLGSRRRDVVAQALRETGNLVVGALVVGQFISGDHFSVPLFFGGLAFWLVFIGGAIICTKEESDG